MFTSFWLESHFWGNTNPAGFHVVNVLLHIANALLVWLICRRLGIGWGWLIAAVFALHPVAVESVAWITERKNVLSGLFYLLGLLSYLRFEKEGRKFFYAAALACFVLGLFSKTVVCTLPVVLLVILWGRRGRWVWKELARLGPFFAIGAGLGLLTAYLERHSVGAVGSEWQIAFWQRFIIAGKAVFFYASKLVWPAKLSFIYPRWEPGEFSPLSLLWPVGVAGVAGLLWGLRKAVGREAIVWWACFVITLFPALGFFDVYPFRYSFVADHFGYPASIYFIIMSMWLINVLYKYLRPEGAGDFKVSLIAVGLAGALLAILGTLTYAQAGSYKDIKTLWQDTTQKNPRAWMAWNNLGEVYVQERDFSAAGECFERAIQADPGYAAGHANYGQVLAIQGEFDAAIKHFRKAIELRDDYVLAHLKLANVYAQLGQYDQAITGYQKTIGLAEKSVLKLDQRERRIEALSHLGGVYAEMGEYELAVRYTQEAIELAREYGFNELMERFEERLKRYQERRAN